MTPVPATLKSATILLFLTATLAAQQYEISTFAGGSPPVTPAAATATSIGLPNGIAVDPAGNVFFAARNCVFRLDPAGTLTRIAGNSRPGPAGDGGLAVNAQMTGPDALALDRAGNLYLTADSRVRMISPAGIITTVAMQIGSPKAIAVDPAGNIYIAGFASGVRRITPAGLIATVAGNGTPGYSGDGGPGANAQVGDIEALAADKAGNLYIADSSNYRVRKLSPDGIITTVAGGGPAATAASRPDGLTLDPNGNLYIASSYNFAIRKIMPSGATATVYAGDATPGAEGVATGLGVDSAGNVYVTDASHYRIRKVSPNGTVTTAAGNGVFSFSGDRGPAFEAQLFGSQAVALDASGNLFIADSYNSRIRRATPGGTIATIAGNGAYGGTGDGGPALNAEFYDPWALAVDAAGNVYVADAVSNRVRKISSDGIVTTVAGTDIGGYSGDGGPATAAQLNGPAALAVDTSGSLYIADGINNRIRRVSPDGIITTVAVTPSPGTAALQGPTGLAVDNAGNLYVADQAGFGRVAKLSPDGTLRTLTGPGDIGGPPRTNQTSYPNAVAVDPSGNIYFTDPYNYRVRKISTDSTIATIAGNGTPGYTGDNEPATQAQLCNPSGLAVSKDGKVYIADGCESAIRLLQPIGASASVALVANAASNASGPIAPGEIVVIYGSMLGPLTPATAPPAGAVVTFNGISAQILYASFTQVAAVAPAALTGATVQISLTFNGQTAPPFQAPLALDAPGIFTLDATGRGQAVATNPDGSINTSTNPASAGSVVSVYVTGAGSAASTIDVTLGGRQITPSSVRGFAGIPGVTEIDFRIPTDLIPGAGVPISVSAGSISSPVGPTLAIGN